MSFHLTSRALLCTLNNMRLYCPAVKPRLFIKMQHHDITEFSGDGQSSLIVPAERTYRVPILPWTSRLLFEWLLVVFLPPSPSSHDLSYESYQLLVVKQGWQKGRVSTK